MCEENIIISFFGFLTLGYVSMLIFGYKVVTSK